MGMGINQMALDMATPNGPWHIGLHLPPHRCVVSSVFNFKQESAMRNFKEIWYISFVALALSIFGGWGGGNAAQYGTPSYLVDSTGEPITADNPLPTLFDPDATITLTGDVVLDTFGALDNTKVVDPDAASATVPALLRGLLNAQGNEYETVAASQTAQVIGATGGTGDFIRGVLVIPATTGAGNVTILDNATSIPVFVGGGTLTDLKPFFIPLGLTSVSGAWKITTGANVSVIAVGNFT
jgi:hypothetical protein